MTASAPVVAQHVRQMWEQRTVGAWLLLLDGEASPMPVEDVVSPAGDVASMTNDVIACDGGGGGTERHAQRYMWRSPSGSRSCEELVSSLTSRRCGRSQPETMNNYEAKGARDALQESVRQLQQDIKKVEVSGMEREIKAAEAALDGVRPPPNMEDTSVRTA